jgi:hypothetical protein
MRQSMPGTQPLWPFRLGGGAAVLVFLALAARCWHPVWGFTAFLQLDSSNDEVKIAAFKTYPVYVHRDVGGYDGLYYAQIAYHPTLKAPELAGALDNFGYRARRILPPALAWLVGLGRPSRIVYVYATLNIVAWLALAVLLWRLLAVHDWRGWLAWFGVMFSAGTLASVRLALTDLVALAIMAAAMMATERSRHRTGAALMAAAGLSRETSLLGIAGLVRRPWRSPANVLRVIMAVAPLAIWLLYIRLSFDSNDPGWANLGRPLSGLAEKLRADVDAARHHGDWQVAWTTLAATAGLVAQAIYVAARPRVADAWWRLGAAYVALMLFLGFPVWEGFPGAATRVLLPMTLAFNVMVIRHRAAPVWLLAGNLAVLSGALTFRDVPRDGRELAAGYVGEAAVVARGGAGWLDIDSGWRRSSASSDGAGRLEVETWPHDDRAIAFEATVTSREPVVLTVSEEGVVLWRNTIFAKPLRVSVPCTVRNGHARLDFSTGASGGSEGTTTRSSGTRFEVEDLRFTAVQSREEPK